MDVAKLGRLSIKTVYRAIWSGELRAKRVRNRWRVTEAAVREWLGLDGEEPA
jgi:excisionase family DNA binding protein